MKKCGFKFVGSTMGYAWVQPVGIVNDHHVRCFRRSARPAQPIVRTDDVRPLPRDAMYYPIILQCTQGLKNIEAWLDQAEHHASAKQFDVGVLMTSRLAPDMRDFVYQVQSACDYVKGAAAWLSGQAPPRHADTEETVDELRARIRKTVAFAESVSEAQYDGAADRKVSWGGKIIGGDDYLLQMSLPNIYFHLTTACAILRHNGVDIGKKDFLGPIRWVDA
jgi:hypothetical protein